MKIKQIVICGICSILLLFMLITVYIKQNRLYPHTALVIDINVELDRVTVTDNNGEEWAFNGVDDWETGDIVSMIMDNMGTTKIYDDEIIKVKYSGHLE